MISRRLRLAFSKSPIIVVNKADALALKTPSALRVMLKWLKENLILMLLQETPPGCNTGTTAETQQPQSGWLPTIHSTIAVDEGHRSAD